MPSDGAVGETSKRESISKAITVSANKLSETIDTFKRDNPGGTHDPDKITKTEQ